MNTTHGYHIDGTRLQSANDVKACGGLAHCGECKDDAAEKLGDLKIREVEIGR